MQCSQHKNRSRARRDWQAPKVNANNSPAPGKKAATARGLSKAPGRGPGGVRHAAPLSCGPIHAALNCSAAAHLPDRGGRRRPFGQRKRGCAASVATDTHRCESISRLGPRTEATTGAGRAAVRQGHPADSQGGAKMAVAARLKVTMDGGVVGRHRHSSCTQDSAGPAPEASPSVPSERQLSLAESYAMFSA